MMNGHDESFNAKQRTRLTHFFWVEYVCGQQGFVPSTTLLLLLLFINRNDLQFFSPDFLLLLLMHGSSALSTRLNM